MDKETVVHRVIDGSNIAPVFLLVNFALSGDKIEINHLYSIS